MRPCAPATTLPRRQCTPSTSPIVGADRAAFIALKLAAAAKEMSEIKKGMTPKEIARVLRVTKLQQMRQAAAVAEAD